LIVGLHGIASNRAVLGDFDSILKDNPDYKQVNLPISDYIKKTNLNFTISIVLK